MADKASTTPPPTTPRTTAATTTTTTAPSPAPPGTPEQGTYFVKNSNGTVCLLTQMGLQLNVSYFSRSQNKVMWRFMSLTFRINSLPNLNWTIIFSTLPDDPRCSKSESQSDKVIRLMWSQHCYIGFVTRGNHHTQLYLHFGKSIPLILWI